MATHREIGYPGGAKRPRFAPTPVTIPAPEESFQSLVIDTAQLHGWRVYHTHNSERSEAGFPDLILVKGHRMFAIELKAVGKAPTMEQVRWLLDLSRVDRVESFAWDATDTDFMLEVLAS